MIQPSTVLEAHLLMDVNQYLEFMCITGHNMTQWVSNKGTHDSKYDAILLGHHGPHLNHDKCALTCL